MEPFQEYLKHIFGLHAVPPEIPLDTSFNGNSRPSIGALLTAIESRQKMLGTLNEDFIVGPLPNDMTLYKPKDIIEITKEFYGRLGFEFTGFTPYPIGVVKGYDEFLDFERHKGQNLEQLTVHLDLGMGYRQDGQYELWVTTMFLGFKKNPNDMRK